MSRITKEEIEKTKCGRFLLSDENIYLSIYSLNSYVFEYNLLNTEDRILYHRLQDKFDARLINRVITRVRKQIIELLDEDKYIEAKMKELNKNYGDIYFDKELMKECERKIAVFEDKISQGKNLKNILEKTFEKVSNVEIGTPKVNEDINKNYGVEDILGLYREGKTVTEISKITGKSLEEIAEMMGI